MIGISSPKFKTHGDQRFHFYYSRIRSRGLELPTDTNPLHVYTLFQDFSVKWETIASANVESVHAICTEFWRGPLNSL